ncbi:MAG: HAMP domain-containing sensor histidine kinase [Pseudomonas sp.]|uniref:sensor histidine kinase n=1 Tax=Pseudomonas sp. TaxID=306 RepID=UPI0033936CD4
MQLSEFIVQNVERFVDEWERFAKTLTPAAECLDRVELRDHAGAILLAAARNMQVPQTAREQAAKAKGEGPEKTPSLNDAAADHGELRHVVGFNLVQMTSEFRALRASVIRLWVEALGTPERDHFDQMIRFNEAIDEALAESTAAYAEQVERSRDIFLAILGHDLRAPLQAILMSTELLARKADLDASTRTALGRIKQGTRQMGTMVKDLLEFVRSRLGAGLPIVRAPMDLADACRSAIDDAQLIHPNVDLRLEIKGDTRGEWDRARMDQVLTNLIGNAVQHGAQNHPVSLRVEGDARHVTLEMHNQGEPIGADILPSLFDPLVRGPSEDLHVNRSTSLGLGLFIVKEVVGTHQGKIEVKSSEALGTTFTVCLPKHG